LVNLGFELSKGVFVAQGIAVKAKEIAHRPRADRLSVCKAESVEQ
jgi:hypothetical protein